MKSAKVLSLAACLLMASTAATLPKDITRHCGAQVLLAILSGSLSYKTIATIEGKGKCGSTVPNRCRERAHDAIVKCLDAMWRDRGKNAIAPECKTLVGDHRGAKLTWYSIFLIREPDRLRSRMAYAACCFMRPQSNNLQVEIHGFITGDKKCGATKIDKKKYQSDWGKPTFDMDCNGWRKLGICSGGG